jgi:hypothetical protein
LDRAQHEQRPREPVRKVRIEAAIQCVPERENVAALDAAAGVIESHAKN